MKQVKEGLEQDIKIFKDAVKTISTKSKHLFKVTEEVRKEQSEISTKLKKIYDRRAAELAIIEEFTLVLKHVKPNTYWVFKIANKETYDSLLKERKEMANLYRRKLKMMESRLRTINIYKNLARATAHL